MRSAALWITLAIVTTSAAAAHWHLVFQRGGYRVYVDSSTVREGRAWFRFEYPEPRPPQGRWPAFRSSLELRRFDCMKQASAIEQQRVFADPGAEGEPLAAAGFADPQLQRAEPGTVGEAILASVCTTD